MAVNIVAALVVLAVVALFGWQVAVVLILMRGVISAH
jgi:hypothetical protein